MDDPGFTLANRQVAVVGLGLMGGSLALALRGHCGEIVGVDSDPAALAFARDRAAIDRAADFESALGCDLLILAAPVRAILSQLDDLARSTSRASHPIVLLDLGSTKVEIVTAMQALPAHFDPIGGHPLCGKEVNGMAHAEAGLYRGKAFVLTPLGRTSPEALALARALVAAVGAKPLVLTAERHDVLAAVTSHLPYVVATALVRAALALEDDQLWEMAASGFRDTSRLAASDLTVMTDILLTNQTATLRALLGYRRELDALIAAIVAGDPEALRAALAPAQARRSELFR